MLTFCFIVARNFQALGAEVIALTASPRTTAEEKKDKGYIIPGTGDTDGTIPTKWMSGLGKDSFHEFLRSQLDCLVLALPLTKRNDELALNSGIRDPQRVKSSRLHTDQYQSRQDDRSGRSSKSLERGYTKRCSA